jgi:hypothetical protein
MRDLLDSRRWNRLIIQGELVNDGQRRLDLRVIDLLLVLLLGQEACC